MKIELQLITRESCRSTDYTVLVDGSAVAIADANSARRGYRLYSDFGGNRFPVRDPKAGAWAPKHVGAEVDSKSSIESRVRELIEQGAPLTAERFTQRAQAIELARHNWRQKTHAEIAARIIAANAESIWETLKGTIPGAPLMVRREPAALVREVESLIKAKQDEYDSAFENPRSVEVYNWLEWARSNV